MLLEVPSYSRMKTWIYSISISFSFLSIRTELKLNWNTRLFTTVLTTKLCFGALDHFQLRVLSRDSALKLCRPNLLNQMSAQKSVAFIKTSRNLVDREETRYYGGQRRHLLTLYQVQHWGIWGTEGPGIFQSVFLVLLLSPTQTTKAPLREPPFFSLNKHTKLPVLGCNCPVLRKALLVVFLCTCFK